MNEPLFHDYSQRYHNAHIMCCDIDICSITHSLVSCLDPGSHYHSDLQLVFFDYFMFLCHKLRHVPSAVDVSPG